MMFQEFIYISKNTDIVVENQKNKKNEQFIEKL